MNPLLELRQQGQSVWLDSISRQFVQSGELERLVREDGLGGVTSNPTIFEKAFRGAEYDDQLGAIVKAEPQMEIQSLFEALALDDIRAAADVLRPVFDGTDGADGFVSFEVPASLANDTAATTREARRLWKSIARPNVMIKVPATPAGIPAIEELIADGVNVNITLMFSLDDYERVAQAYIRGLERCARPAQVSSVASFFVSRVDTVVDKLLERLGTPEALALRGRAAIANSKIVYQRFRELFHGATFAALRQRGCRVQRPLWASTSTKNPAYRDVVYVEELVGPETVNTLPPATLDAFRDHGRVRSGSVEEDLEGARGVLQHLKRVGVDLDAVTRELQLEGVASFARSYEDLAAALERKRRDMSGSGGAQSWQLGPYEAPVRQRLQSWEQQDLAARIWARDHTVWSPRPVPELEDRLGWLAMPTSMLNEVRELEAFADEVRASGIEHVVLLGMGGSSLAPEVYQSTFGAREGYPSLTVLDSTHPAAVRDAERRVDLATALFLVSSKSGTTSETNSFFQYFWSRYGAEASAGSHFVAITDPGTPLERLARDRRFRRTFAAPPDVGGRYSALTVFGLVPAALIGVPLAGLLERAAALASSAASAQPSANPALALGAAIGELARAGRDKLTFFVTRSLEALPAWLEQLIAESTGKDGTGIVPVADEPLLPVADYGRDRLFVSLSVRGSGSASGLSPEQEALLRALEAAGHPVIRIALDSTLDLGAEFFRWEFAVAAAGAALGIQPFDQPDVQVAKEMARQAMASGGGSAAPNGVPPLLTDAAGWRAAVEGWLSGAGQGDYIGLQAYLPPAAATTAAFQRLRHVLARRARAATTLGYGPRFLHSTGQLHKGGANNGLFVQFTDEATPDLAVPETGYTFGQLIRAQAAGDAMALAARGRRVIRLGLGREPAADIEGLAAALDRPDGGR